MTEQLEVKMLEELERWLMKNHVPGLALVYLGIFFGVVVPVYAIWCGLKPINGVELKGDGMFFIGSLRRFLFMPFSCKWNAWVRDITAKYEGSWLIRSAK